MSQNDWWKYIQEVTKLDCKNTEDFFQNLDYFMGLCKKMRQHLTPETFTALKRSINEMYDIMGETLKVKRENLQLFKNFLENVGKNDTFIPLVLFLLLLILGYDSSPQTLKILKQSR